MKLDSRKMILVLLPAVMAPIALAQEGSAVRNLSVKPRLQASGTFYTCADNRMAVLESCCSQSTQGD